MLTRVAIVLLVLSVVVMETRAQRGCYCANSSGAGLYSSETLNLGGRLLVGTSIKGECFPSTGLTKVMIQLRVTKNHPDLIGEDVWSLRTAWNFARPRC